MTNAWAGASGGLWDNPANWSEGQVPDQKPWEDVGIYGSALGRVEVLKPNPSATVIQSLTIGRNASLEVTGSAENQDQAFSVNSLSVLEGGVLAIDTSSPVSLGSSPKIDGTLTISGNDQVSINSHSITGNGTVVLDGAAIGSTSQMFVLDPELTTVLKNGSTLYVNNAQAGKEIRFVSTSVAGESNRLTFADYNQNVSTQITGVDASSVIHIANGQRMPSHADFKPNGDGTYTLNIRFDDWGNGIFLTNITPVVGFVLGSASIVPTRDGGWDIVAASACFLEGCLIRTTEGYKPVEEIMPGDKVLTLQNGPQEVVWRGRGHTAISGPFGVVAEFGPLYVPDDVSGYPVCVKAGALAPNIPFADMRVTSEHCLYLDNVFVPVRMLVNGDTIAYDHATSDYNFYHIETAEHSIILCNGVATESYLGSQGRKSFTEALRSPNFDTERNLEWGEHSAAPLIACHNQARRLFDQISSFADPNKLRRKPELTSDPDIHLTTDNGAVIRPIRVNGKTYSFMVPPGTGSVHILSRCNRPCDTVGPFLDDRRNLGVLVGQISWMKALGRQGPQTSSEHLDRADLAGWYPKENDSSRWTNGRATLSMSETCDNSVVLLSIEVLSAGPYINDKQLVLSPQSPARAFCG